MKITEEHLKDKYVILEMSNGLHHYYDIQNHEVVMTDDNDAVIKTMSIRDYLKENGIELLVLHERLYKDLINGLLVDIGCLISYEKIKDHINWCNLMELCYIDWGETLKMFPLLTLKHIVVANWGWAFIEIGILGS